MSSLDVERYFDLNGLNQLLHSRRSERVTRRLQEARFIQTTGLPQIRIRFPSEQAGSLADLLADLDREVRRTSGTVELAQGRSYPSVGKVLRTTEAGLLLREGEHGRSFEFIAAAYGVAQAVLLARPLQTLITLQWLWERRPQRRSAAAWGKQGGHAPPVYVSAPATGNVGAAIAAMDNLGQAALNQGKDVRMRLDIHGDASLSVELETVEPRQVLQ